MNEFAEAIKNSTPGKWEYFFENVPFIAHPLEQKRFKPIVSGIEKKLQERNELEVKQRWDESPYDYEIAACLMNIALDCIGWSKNSFLPDDPLLVIFWAHEDGLDNEEAVLAIEDRFNFTFTDDELIETENFSFGQFVEFIESKRKQS